MTSLADIGARRRRTDRVARTMLAVATGLALVPLVLILFFLVKQPSSPSFSPLDLSGKWRFYGTLTSRAGSDSGGGWGVGTFAIAYNGGFTGGSLFSSEGLNAFVAKLNAAGTALVYSTAFIGSKDEIGFGVAVDSSGNAYATGYTRSTNFPVTRI